MSAITIHSRRFNVQPERFTDHIRLQGEEVWYLEGSEENIEQAAATLAGLCEPITNQVLQVSFGNAVGWFKVPGLGLLEVVSGKWGSSDFDRMLVELSVWAAALPFSSQGASVASERSATEQASILYHAFVYLRSVLSHDVPPERRLLDALHVVMQHPHRQLIHAQREVPLEAVRQIESSLLEDLAAGRYPLQQVKGPMRHRLAVAERLRGFIPEYVGDMQSEIMFDTPENRFVKAFLDYALSTIARMRQFIEGKPPELRNAFQRRVLEDCDRMDNALRPIRQHAMWKEIGPMVHVPVGSTVLQRQQGYREIFEHYSRMLLATRVPLSKETERDLLEVKDIARLYELWCYFACVRQIEFLLGSPVAAGRLEAKVTELIAPWGIEVRWQNGVRLVYNAHFSRASPAQRYSYSVPLRPDIVLEVPYGINRGLHLLDAKFKVKIVDVLQSRDLSLDAELSPNEHRGQYKPEDIYKMHAYLDAIQQARSAWILYPGDELCYFGRSDYALIQVAQTLPEIIEGVGAVPLKPGGERHPELIQVLGRMLGL